MTLTSCKMICTVKDLNLHFESLQISMTLQTKFEHRYAFVSQFQIAYFTLVLPAIEFYARIVRTCSWQGELLIACGGGAVVVCEIATTDVQACTLHSNEFLGGRRPAITQN